MKVFFWILAVFILAQPLYAQTTIKGSVTLTATAVDPQPDAAVPACGVAYVQFFNGASALGAPITAPSADGSYQLVLDTKTLPNGAYTFTAKAADKAGPEGACDGATPNIGTSPAVQVVVNNIPPDVTAPTITIKVEATITIKVN